VDSPFNTIASLVYSLYFGPIVSVPSIFDVVEVDTMFCSCTTFSRFFDGSFFLGGQVARGEREKEPKAGVRRYWGLFGSVLCIGRKGCRGRAGDLARLGHSSLVFSFNDSFLVSSYTLFLFSLPWSRVVREREECDF